MYGNQYIIDSPNNKALMQLFHETCGRYGMAHDNDRIFEYLHKFEDKAQNAQITLWDLQI